MAFTIVISDTVGFTVKGSINNAKGVAEPFNFGLTAKRMNTDEIREAVNDQSEATLADFLAGTPTKEGLITGWSAVRGPDGKDLEFGGDGLRQMFKIPGLAGLVLTTYLREVGAKEKN